MNQTQTPATETNTPEPAGPTENQLANYIALSRRLGDTRDAVELMEEELAELEDKILTHAENLETNEFIIGQHHVRIGKGIPLVNWQREFKRVASAEAVERAIDSSPVVPVVSVEKVPG